MSTTYDVEYKNLLIKKMLLKYLKIKLDMDFGMIHPL